MTSMLMTPEVMSALRQCAPTCLAPAREAAHRAAQLAARAAIANLPARADYSHTALSWDAESGALAAEPLLEGALILRLGLAPLRLEILSQGAAKSFNLAGRSDAEALSWLDARLEAAGAAPASAAALSEGLPAGVAALESYDAGLAEPLETLVAWYALSAAGLERLAVAHSSIAPGPTPLRCWPHHFDIATLVRFSNSEAEDAPAIGAGMAPGDAAYDQPYFYVNPWPHLDAAAPKPKLPLGRWHLDGFVGAVLTGAELLEQADPAAALDKFLGAAFELGRGELAL